MTINWLEYRERGFYCVPGDFYIDPHGVAGVGVAVVSHAHADHYPRGLNTVYATPPTLAIAQQRYGNQAGKTQHAVPYHTTFKVKEVEVKFLPAGHILGSAQILLTYQGQTVLYTGDVSLRPNESCEPLESPDVPIDLMICESTFAAKERHTDPAEALLKARAAADGRHLMIGVYSVGKAQHVSQLLRKTLPNMEVFLHYEIFRYHQIYEAHGIDLGAYRHYRRSDVKGMLFPHAYLVPPRVLSGYAKDYRYYKVMASGWEAKLRYPYLDGNLDISDHVDASDIQAYLQRVKPKGVWFWHGSPSPLLRWCGETGVVAREIKRGELVGDE